MAVHATIAAPPSRLAAEHPSRDHRSSRLSLGSGVGQPRFPITCTAPLVGARNAITRVRSRDSVVSASAAAGTAGGFEDSSKMPAGEPERNAGEQGITPNKNAADKFMANCVWSARNFVLASVAGSLIMSALMFFQGVVGVWHCLVAVVKCTAAGTITLERPDVAVLCVEVLDKFLCGIVTYIFGTGVFELFIHEIDFSEGKPTKEGEDRRPQWLHVEGIDDLEHNLGKVVITILVVNLMAAAKKVAVAQPQDLVFIAAAVLLAALALTVLHWAGSLH